MSHQQTGSPCVVQLRLDGYLDVYELSAATRRTNPSRLLGGGGLLLVSNTGLVLASASEAVLSLHQCIVKPYEGRGPVYDDRTNEAGTSH